MPTYVYESIPSDGGEPERFEIVQGMNEAPLTAHPETGEPVRRIVTGGLGVLGKPIRRSTTVDKSLAAATPCGCAKDSLAAMASARRPLGQCRQTGLGHSHARPRPGPHHRH